MTFSSLWAAVLVTVALQTPSPPEAQPTPVAPRLVEGASQALRANPGVAAARESLRAAGYEASAARWMRYPSMSIGAATGDSLSGDVTVQVDVFQPLWDGGRVEGGVDRARALETVARAGVAETELDVLLRLSTAYHDAMRARRVAAIMADSLAEHRLLVGSMERRVQQEVSPRTDLELAVARAAQVEQELAGVEAQDRAATRRFRTLIGDPDFDLGEAPPYQPVAHHPFGDEAVDLAVRCHPRLARLGAEAAVAQAEVRVRRAEALPTLGAQYSHDRFNGHQIGLALRMQTSGGLAPLASAQAASARRLGVEQQARLARQEVEEAMALDLVENLSARARIDSTGAAARSTAQVMESFLRQFAAGRRTWLDVMNAVRERTAARITHADVEISAMASSTRLLLNTCAWRPAASDAAETGA